MISSCSHNLEILETNKILLTKNIHPIVIKQITAFLHVSKNTEKAKNKREASARLQSFRKAFGQYFRASSRDKINTKRTNNNKTDLPN